MFSQEATLNCFFAVGPPCRLTCTGIGHTGVAGARASHSFSILEQKVLSTCSVSGIVRGTAYRSDKAEQAV